MKQLFSNNAKTFLAANLNNSATTITVLNGSILPNPGSNEFFLLTIDDSTNIEVVQVTARSGNSLTVTRGYDGTTPLAFNSGTLCELRLTASTLANLSTSLVPITSISSILPPYASYATGYITGTQDDQGNAISLVKKSTTEWSFLNFVVLSTCTVTGTPTTTSVATTTTTGLGTVVSGRYLLQFTTGTYAGQIRVILSSTLASGITTFTWTDVLGGTPSTGDTFKVYQSQSSYITGLLTAAGFVANTRQVATATGLSGGGDLTADRTIALNINALPTKATPSPTGDLILLYDGTSNSHKTATPGSIVPSSDPTIVRTSRQILPGIGLAGGGDLTSDRTLRLDISNLSVQPGLAAGDRIPTYNAAGSTTGYVLFSTIAATSSAVGVVQQSGSTTMTAQGSFTNLFNFVITTGPKGIIDLTYHIYIENFNQEHDTNAAIRVIETTGNTVLLSDSTPGSGSNNDVGRTILGGRLAKVLTANTSYTLQVQYTMSQSAAATKTVTWNAGGLTL